MSLINEFKNSNERTKNRISEFKALIKEYNVKDIQAFVKLSQENPDFHSKWGAIWSKVIKDERGKISCLTIGLIIGGVFGGIGVAALGGAVGIPGLIAGGAIGILCGAEVDSIRGQSN